jgi:hypothetical protein
MKTTRKYKDLIFNKKAKLIDCFSHLKSEESLADIRDVITELEKYKMYHSFLFGKLKPSSFKELGEGRTLYFVESFEKQLNWLTLIIEKYSDEINNFLLKKDEYEKNLLLGDYTSALENIDAIDKEICSSLWSIENRLIIAEQQGGLEKNKEILSEINSENKNQFVAIFSDFLSRRIEKNVSVPKYIETLEKYLEKVTGGGKQLTEYFHFKLNFYNYADFKYFAEIIHTEGRLSILDMYNTFTQIMQLILKDHSFSKYHDTVLKNISILEKSINDQQLRNLLLLNNTQFLESYKLNEDENKFLEILDKYTVGDYVGAISASEKILMRRPNTFQLYEMYIKSFINLGNPIESFSKTPKDSLLSNILINMYNIYMKNEKTSESITYLKKLNSVLGTNSINTILFAFLREYSGGSDANVNTFITQVNSSFVSPRFSESYTDVTQSVTFLKILQHQLQGRESNTIKFYLNNYNNMLNGKYEYTRVATSFREKKYEATYYIRNKEFDKAILILEKLIENSKVDDGFLYESLTLNLFNCYLNEKSLDKALMLTVRNYLKNKYLIMRLNINELSNLLEENSDYKFLDIELGIVILNFLLHNIHDTKGQRKIYSSYAVFLRNNNLEKPIDLKKLESRLNKTELIFFLRNICVPMIMDSSYVFDNLEDIDNERIAICQWLSEIDYNNKDIYIKEISLITKNSMVIKRIQEVEESKIYVDTDGIQKSSDQSFKESFERYKQFASFNKEDIYQIMDLFRQSGLNFEHFIVYDTSENVSIISNDYFSRDYKFLAYKEIFMDLRDIFISSNEYGLDSYLSTRIRHGTILSQLRSVFKSENLVTEKDKITGSYTKNELWYEKLGFENDIVYGIFNEFSEKIDNIILTVPSELIQIKTEDKNKLGLFDFIFTDSQIYDNYLKNKDINDYQDLMKEIFSELWIRTDESLAKIKKVLSTEIQDELMLEINSLMSEFQALLGKTNQSEGISDLFSSIARCRTNIQTEIKNVCKWFNLPEEKSQKDFTIEELIDTCTEILNRLYPNNDLEYTKDLRVAGKLKGVTFPYFVDIFLIMFDNIIKHASHKMKKQDVRVVVKEGIGLEINVTNELNLDVAEENILNTNIQDIRSKLKRGVNSHHIKSEGGSGFFKIKKIINYDLKTKGDLEIIAEQNLFCVKISLQKERILINEYSYN